MFLLVVVVPRLFWLCGCHCNRRTKSLAVCKSSGIYLLKFACVTYILIFLSILFP